MTHPKDPNQDNSRHAALSKIVTRSGSRVATLLLLGFQFGMSPTATIVMADDAEATLDRILADWAQRREGIRTIAEGCIPFLRT